MTTRQRQWLLGGLLLLALLGLGGYLFEQLQPYQSTVKHGPSPEARRNPYLAAEHFLRLQQIPVQRAANFSTLHDLPAMGHSLLVLGAQQAQPDPAKAPARLGSPWRSPAVRGRSPV